MTVEDKFAKLCCSTGEMQPNTISHTTVGMHVMLAGIAVKRMRNAYAAA